MNPEHCRTHIWFLPPVWWYWRIVFYLFYSFKSLVIYSQEKILGNEARISFKLEVKRDISLCGILEPLICDTFPRIFYSLSSIDCATTFYLSGHPFTLLQLNCVIFEYCIYLKIRNRQEHQPSFHFFVWSYFFLSFCH